MSSHCRPGTATHQKGMERCASHMRFEKFHFKPRRSSELTRPQNVQVHGSSQEFRQCLPVPLPTLPRPRQRLACWINTCGDRVCVQLEAVKATKEEELAKLKTNNKMKTKQVYRSFSAATDTWESAPKPKKPPEQQLTLLLPPQLQLPSRSDGTSVELVRVTC